MCGNFFPLNEEDITEVVVVAGVTDVVEVTDVDNAAIVVMEAVVVVPVDVMAAVLTDEVMLTDTVTWEIGVEGVGGVGMGVEVLLALFTVPLVRGDLIVFTLVSV